MFLASRLLIGGNPLKKKLKSLGWQCSKESLQSGMNLAWIGGAK